MAAAYLAEPLTNEAVPNTRFVGKLIPFLAFLVGLGGAVIFMRGGDAQQLVLNPATSMAVQPVQLGRVQQLLQPARARNFMQPLKASKSPSELLDIVIPVTNGKSKTASGEIDIIVPVTKREMMGGVAASIAAAASGVAHAEGKARGFDSAQPRVSACFKVLVSSPMIDVVLEAADDTGQIIAWKTQVDPHQPLQRLVDGWFAKYYVGEKDGFYGAGLEREEEPGLLELGCTPSQLEWQSGDPCRTLWVVPLDSRNEAADTLPTPLGRVGAVEKSSETDEQKAKRTKLSPVDNLKPEVAPARPVEAPVRKPEKQQAAINFLKSQAAASSVPAAIRPAPSVAKLAPAAPKPQVPSSGSCPSGNDAIVFVQTNPKRAGSQSAKRYDKYKVAKTVSEALRLGAVPGDIPNDFNKGFLKRA